MVMTVVVMKMMETARPIAWTGLGWAHKAQCQDRCGQANT
jgi:hypothetical protein